MEQPWGAPSGLPAQGSTATAQKSPLGGMAAILMGGACFPLIDLTSSPQASAAAALLGVGVSSPQSTRTLPQGALVPIRWSASNRTGFEGLVTILVQSRSDFSETILEGGIRVIDSAIDQEFIWDTSTFLSDEYAVKVRIDAGGLSRDATANGRIRVNEPPTLEFLLPEQDTTLSFDPNAPKDGEDETNTSKLIKPAGTMQVVKGAVTISWVAFDRESDATVRILLRDEQDDPDGEDEILLFEGDVDNRDQSTSFTFSGNNEAGGPVPEGAYRLLARVDDEVNEELVVLAPARITVPERPDDDDVTLAVTKPDEDVEFLASQDPLEIEFTLDEPDDVLIDLKVDTDDENLNDNVITILSQRLIETGTKKDTFDWDGTDSSGNPVPDNIYRVLMVVNRGVGTPTIVSADGLVFRRDDANRPLIALLAPASETTVSPGQFITIRWRDDDPTGEATIRLTLDDDATPNELVETGAPEIEILADRPAAGDGVQDTFAFQVPGTLAPGRYWVFAYIDRNGAAPWDHISVAGGQIRIPDPNDSGN